MSAGQPVRLVGKDSEAAEQLLRDYEQKEALAQRELQPPSPQSLPEFASPETWPLCPMPGCGAGLHIVDQNPAGDFAFECLSGGMTVGHDYKAVYRVGPKRYEPRPLFDHEGKQVPVESVIEMMRWLHPKTQKPRAVAPPPASIPPVLEVPGGEATLVTMPTVLTPMRIARLFKGGQSMTEIAAEYGIDLQEVEASIRAAALMEPKAEAPAPARFEAPPPAAAAKPPVRRRRRRRIQRASPAAPPPSEPT